MASNNAVKGRIAAQNRRARRDYAIEETFEAGLVLTGTEVKSLRLAQASINEAYAGVRKGELYLINAHIPEYKPGIRFTHAPRRDRKLLLKGREIRKLLGAVEREGMTLIPLSIYFNQRGLAKIELALARGRTHRDKRDVIKERDWKMEQARLRREKG